MNQFLRMLLRKYLQENKKISKNYDEVFSQITDELKKLLPEKEYSRLIFMLTISMNEAFYIAGVAGMELVIKMIEEEYEDFDD